MKKEILLTFVFSFTTVLYLFPFSVFAEELKIGSNIQSENLIQYEDQFGETKEISIDTKYLIFASDMEGTKIAHEFFEAKKGEFLLEKKAVFVGDIHRMPFIISKLIAIPKMRKYNYTIHLIRDDKKGEFFPKEKGKLTGFVLDKYTIKSLQTISSVKELEDFFTSPPTKKGKLPE